MTVAVVACAEAIGKELARLPEGVIAVDDLCSRPGRLGDVVGEADTLVLVLHPVDLELSRLQAAVRKAGFDPFGVPLIDVAGAAGKTERLEVIIAGAAARAAEFLGSRPEQARPVASRKISRRALLSLPRPHYEAVPAIDHGACAAADGCKACVDMCPAGAYRPVGRRIDFDKFACVTCGLCVTGCPAGAIENPLVAPQGLIAQITSIVDGAGGAGVVFTCARSTIPVTASDWYEISVPCSGMIPGPWLAAALLLGAAAATIRPCSEGGCPLGLDEFVARSVTFGRRLATAGGFATATVPDHLGKVPPRQEEEFGRLLDPFGVHGPSEVLLALATRVGPVEIEGESSPMGVIAIDAAACTLCTMCAETCPTGALEHGYDEGAMTLSFDAALCTACSQCLPTCPESERGAITLFRRADSEAVARGRIIVQRTETARCDSCGRPIAPVAALERIASLLGEEHAETARYLATRCMDCRGLG